MGIAIVATRVFILSLLVATAVAVMFQLGRHPRAAAGLSFAGVGLAGATIALLTGAPFALRSRLSPIDVWPDYLLAMAHFLSRASPFPFFWEPWWVYVVGAMTPLAVIGGAAAAVFGFTANRAGVRAGVFSGAAGLLVLAVYVVLAAAAARITWDGIGL